jgi:hypothetical protein
VSVSYPPQDPMYAPFVKGGPEGLEGSWDGKIANLFLQCTVQNVHPLLHFEDKKQFGCPTPPMRTRCTRRL